MAAFRNDSIFWVEVDKIVPNPFQPRREFDEGKLKELSESIRMYGVLQPLTVSRVEVPLDNGAFRSEYELIAGERRLRASRLAGLSQVPVLIREGDESEQEKLELAIIENLQREDLNAVDRAMAFRQLADVFGLSHAQVAKKVGRSREYVSNSIRLLGLPDYMLQSLKEGDISEGHGRTLLMLNDRPEEQDTVFREILLKKLSVREVERIARKIATEKVRTKKWQDSDPELIEKEKEFTETLGTRVQLVKTDYGGKITIDYFSDDDLQNFLNMMKNSAKRFEPTVASVIADEVAETERETDTALSNMSAIETVTSSTPLEEVVEDTVDDLEEDVALEAVLRGVDSESNVDTAGEVMQEIAADEELVNNISEEIEAGEELSENIKEEVWPVIETPTVRSSLRDRLAQFFGESKISTPDEVVVEDVKPVEDDVTESKPDASENVQIETKKETEDDIYNIRNFNI